AFRERVVTQHETLIITQSEQGFGRVRLQFLRVLQGSFGRIAASGGFVTAPEVKIRIRTRKPRPSERKNRVKLHRSLIKTDRFSQGIGFATCFKSQSAQIGVVSF